MAVRAFRTGFIYAIIIVYELNSNPAWKKQWEKAYENQNHAVFRAPAARSGRVIAITLQTEANKLECQFQPGSKSGGDSAR